MYSREESESETSQQQVIPVPLFSLVVNLPRGHNIRVTGAENLCLLSIPFRCSFIIRSLRSFISRWADDGHDADEGTRHEIIVHARCAPRHQLTDLWTSGYPTCVCDHGP